MGRKIIIDDSLLIKLFRDDYLPVNQISKIMGIDRGTVKKNLIRLGFEPPGYHEGAIRSYTNGRIPNTGPAHDSIRGIKRPHKELLKRAKFYSGKIRSVYEQMLFDALIKIGENPIPNLAIDKFNIDLAFPDVKLAVEVDGGNWHSSPIKQMHDAEKTSFLVPLGWKIVRYRFDKREGFDVNIYAANIKSRLENMRHRPS